MGLQVAAVDHHNGKSWKLIASTVGGDKSHIQCLHRWQKVRGQTLCVHHILVCARLASYRCASKFPSRCSGFP
jgi:hypothetical protein